MKAVATGCRGACMGIAEIPVVVVVVAVGTGHGSLPCQLALQVPGTKSMESCGGGGAAPSTTATTTTTTTTTTVQCSCAVQCGSAIQAILVRPMRALASQWRVQTTGPLWALGHVTCDMGH